MKINYSTVANDKLASYRYRIKIPSEYFKEWGHEVVIGKPEQADVGVFSKHFNPRDPEYARQPTRYGGSYLMSVTTIWMGLIGIIMSV